MWIQTSAGGIGALAYAPDGRSLYAADSTGHVTEWDTAARTRRRTFAIGSTAPFGLFCAAGGRFLVARGHAPLIWDLTSGTVHGRLTLDDSDLGYVGSPGSPRTDPADDTRLLFVSADHSRIRTWDTATRAVGPDFGAWPDHGKLRWFDVSPDGRFVALVSPDHAGKVALVERATGRPLRSFDFALGRRALCVCFSPDGLTCAVGGSNKRFAVFDVDL